MGLHVSGASAQPIRCPSGIWRYQDLFLLSMGSGLPRRKLGAIILSTRGGSDVGRRSRCGGSGRLWTANAALM